jgi:hypothetical protein
MGFLNHFLSFAGGVVLNEVTEAQLLLRGKFAKLQAYLAHFYRMAKSSAYLRGNYTAE